MNYRRSNCFAQWGSFRLNGNRDRVYISNLANVHYNDVIMSTTASQITSITIVYSFICSRRRSKKTSKFSVTGLCVGNSPVTDEFPTQRASNAENVSIWWRHHAPYRFRQHNFVWLYPYLSGLLHWYLGNHTTTPVPVQQPCRLWVNMSNSDY